MTSFQCSIRVLYGILLDDLILNGNGIRGCDVESVVSILDGYRFDSSIEYVDFINQLHSMNTKCSRFMKRYIHRLMFYRMGFDWKILNVCIPQRDMSGYDARTRQWYSVNIGLELWELS